MREWTWRERASRARDYFFGRNALIGIASLMLLAISGYATWSGMSDFIVGVSATADQGRETPLGLSVTNEALVIAIVVALTFLMWLALRETFGRDRFFFRERLVTFALYAFLALWSIGFGYGFWWSLIAGQEATRTSLSNLQEDARDASAVIAARLDAVKIQLDSVVSWSESQMAREETSGGSCGVSSGAGRGPLYNARKSVRDSVASLRDGIAESWVTPVQADIKDLQDAAARLDGGTLEERQRRFEATAALIRGKAKGIAARSNALGESTAGEMRALAQSVSVSPGKAGFSCYDPTLATRLQQAADQSAQPAVLNLREASFSEGPAGVANAVKGMWAQIGSFITRNIWGSDDGAKAKRAEPITGRDLIALLATLGIDLGLFALTVLNPPATPPNRNQLTGAEIVRTRRAIRTALEPATMASPDADLDWVRRHIFHHIGTRSSWVSRNVHDQLSSKNTASFFVIPNLSAIPINAPKGETQRPDEEQRGLAMNQVAGVLTDSDVIRALSEKELKHARDEMKRQSKTRLHDDDKMQNHGMLAKAHRALQMAGWSDQACNDMEIFRLVEADGLLPLLIILQDSSTGEEGAGEEEDAAIAAEAKPSGKKGLFARS